MATYLLNLLPSTAIQNEIPYTPKLGPEGVPVQDPTLYRSLARGYSILISRQIYLMRSSVLKLSTVVLLTLSQRLHGFAIFFIDIHFVRDMATASEVRVLHVPSRYQYVDIFTKGLPSALFEEFRSSLIVHPPPALTAGAY
ncbi:hypothetical protein Tco_0986648 [Tanacetum coccineum]